MTDYLPATIAWVCAGLLLLLVASWLFLRVVRYRKLTAPFAGLLFYFVRPAPIGTPFISALIVAAGVYFILSVIEEIGKDPGGSARAGPNGNRDDGISVSGIHEREASQRMTDNQRRQRDSFFR